MNWFDPKFRKNKMRYVLQCALITLIIALVLWILDALSDAAIVAALGASSFIAFTMPHRAVSRPRYLIGGYVTGIASGAMANAASKLLAFLTEKPIDGPPEVFFAALAAGTAIFIMVAMDFEHPPAAGIAMGLVFNACNPASILVVVAGIVILTTVKTLLRPILIDLL